MYAVIYMREEFDDEIPFIKSVELFPTFEEAMEQTHQIVDAFIDKYGIDDVDYATKKNPVTTMYNGEIYEYIYIKEVKNK